MSSIDVHPPVETLKLGDRVRAFHDGLTVPGVWELVSIERRDGQKLYHFKSFPRDGVSQLNVVRPYTPIRVVSV